ncbi:unnamed protein product [Trichogramma brassicae]|uniref:Uncharacterized protein n=1 Tax=Trichogramma brassicae TaxID=86971 RepID=A0A6H5ILR6_9HYME|nr:unnamed protein product [Trichogramma brassicae]
MIDTFESIAPSCALLVLSLAHRRKRSTREAASSSTSTVSATASKRCSVIQKNATSSRCRAARNCSRRPNVPTSSSTASCTTSCQRSTTRAFYFSLPISRRYLRPSKSSIPRVPRRGRQRTIFRRAYSTGLRPPTNISAKMSTSCRSRSAKLYASSSTTIRKNSMYNKW